MSVFVLVHGAWHGGWCWERVARVLAAAGHAVHAPTLTGLGERAGEARPDTGLAVHVADVVGLVERLDLRDVVLVGHSYGGMVVTGAASRLGGRVRTLVYLDAFVPEAGQSVNAIVGPEAAAGTQRIADAKGEGWRVPMVYPLEAMGRFDAETAAWAAARLTPQPVATFTEPVSLGDARVSDRVYVYCSDRPLGIFGRFAEAARANPAEWRYVELPTGHDAMLTMPNAVAGILLDL
jgi:pimeloyl-ACP methyl ester carboxylesterase